MRCRIGNSNVIAVFAFAQLAACSVLVHPDLDRLGNGDVVRVDGAAMIDGTVIDDRNLPDVIGVDRVVDDRPPPPDVIRVDVPVDVPVADVPPACPGGCDDHVTCTVDRCNPATNHCESMPDSTMCPSGMICDPRMGCMMQPCMSNAECDDHNACNGTEQCAVGRCVGSAPLRCDDGQFCNGLETCDPARGCIMGATPACSDGTPCTIDRCNFRASSGNGACENPAVDMDLDGVPAAVVAGTRCTGTDCDDSNPSVHPGATEVCANGLDDDCDGMIDNPAICMPMGGTGTDTCVTPTAVNLTAGGTTTVINGTTVGMMSNISSICGGDGGGDVFFAVSWPGNTDLRAEVAVPGGAADSVLIIRDSCGSAANLVCNDDISARGPGGRGSRIWIRADPASTSVRTVIVAVDAFMRGSESTFALSLSASTPTATGTCGGTPFDVSPGGTVLAQSQTGHSFYMGSCGTGSGSDDAYAYRGATGNVDVAALASTRIVSYVRSSSCMGGSELACQSGSPATYAFNHMGGSSYIFVDGLFSTSSGGTYLLRVVAP